MIEVGQIYRQTTNNYLIIIVKKLLQNNVRCADSDMEFEFNRIENIFGFDKVLVSPGDFTTALLQLEKISDSFIRAVRELRPELLE